MAVGTVRCWTREAPRGDRKLAAQRRRPPGLRAHAHLPAARPRRRVHVDPTRAAWPPAVGKNRERTPVDRRLHHRASPATSVHAHDHDVARPGRAGSQLTAEAAGGGGGAAARSSATSDEEEGARRAARVTPGAAAGGTARSRRRARTQAADRSARCRRRGLFFLGVGALELGHVAGDLGVLGHDLARGSGRTASRPRRGRSGRWWRAEQRQHALARAPAWPWDSRCPRCSAARSPTGSPSARPARGRRVQHADDARRPLVAGRAARRAARASSGSEAVPDSRTGRVWGTSASSAPSVSTRVTSQRRASSSTVAQYVFQRRCGSAATPTMRSRGERRRPGDRELRGRPDDLALVSELRLVAHVGAA